MKMFDADKTRMIGLPCGEKNYRNRNRNHTESMLPPTQDRRPSTMSKMIVVIGRQSKTEMSLVCV